MGKILLGNGIVTDGVSTFIENGAILISDGKIGKIGGTNELKSQNAEYFDVGGRVILPGFLNPHHHLYSSLATGLAPAGDVENFVDILEKLWWRFDALLDEEAVYTSALVGIIDSVKHGVTTIFDHHASMNFVSGSLDTVESAFKIAGIKGLLCFETSDRMGRDSVAQHIEENIDFYRRHKNNGNINGAFGMHANFTLSDDTLSAISKAKPAEMPIHIHCGEDFYDFQFCRELGYAGPVDRLDKFGLLDEKSLLAHAIHLGERDYDIINRIKPIVITNPESNANNRVGTMNRKRIGRYLIGTDGISGDIVASLRSAYLLNSMDGISFEELSRAFFSERYRAQKVFFKNSGEFRTGIDADIAVLDYIPITDISPQNLLEHLIFGAKTAKVYITIANGKVLYADGEIKFADEKKIISEARKIAKYLWEKF